jgi:2-oxoglutarate ferredoxin oxidoreductase subunit beta
MKVVRIGENDITTGDLLKHDAKEPNPGIHYMLANMRYPEYPVALGVIRAVEGKTYETDMEEQIRNIKADSKIKSMDDLLKSGSTWEVR